MPFEQFCQPLVRVRATHCELCACQLASGAKEHQCRRCYRQVCHSCIKQTQLLRQTVSSVGRQTQQVCSHCSKEIQWIEQLVSRYSLAFNAGSSIGKYWRDAVSDGAQQSTLLIEFTQNLRRRCAQSQKLLSSRNDIRQNFWNSLNFSLLSLLVRCKGGVSEEQFFTTVEEVSVAVLNCFRGQKQFKSALLHLVAFLLCFTQKEVCYKIVCNLHLTMQREKQRMAHQSLCQKISEDVRRLGVDLNQDEAIAQFLRNDGEEILNRYTVNSFSTELTLFIVHQVIVSQDWMEARAGIGCNLLDRIQSIISSKSKQLKRLMLVRAPVVSFYSLYSRIIGRSYSSFRLSKEITRRLPVIRPTPVPCDEEQESIWEVEPTLAGIRTEVSQKDERIRLLQNQLKQLTAILQSSKRQRLRLDESQGDNQLRAELSTARFQNLVLREEEAKLRAENKFYLQKITELTNLLVEYTSKQIFCD